MSWSQVKKVEIVFQAEETYYKAVLWERTQPVSEIDRSRWS